MWSAGVKRSKTYKKQSKGKEKKAYRPFLTSSIPDLGPNDFVIHDNRLGLKLNSDRGLGLEIELIPGISWQELGLSDAGVSDHDDLEHVVDPLIQIGVPVGHLRHGSKSALECCSLFCAKRSEIGYGVRGEAWGLKEGRKEGVLGKKEGKRKAERRRYWMSVSRFAFLFYALRTRKRLSCQKN